jgi:hypothetical protein
MPALVMTEASEKIAKVFAAGSGLKLERAARTQMTAAGTV